MFQICFTYFKMSQNPRFFHNFWMLIKVCRLEQKFGVVSIILSLNFLSSRWLYLQSARRKVPRHTCNPTTQIHTHTHSHSQTHNTYTHIHTHTDKHTSTHTRTDKKYNRMNKFKGIICNYLSCCLKYEWIIEIQLITKKKNNVLLTCQKLFSLLTGSPPQEV